MKTRLVYLYRYAGRAPLRQKYPHSIKIAGIFYYLANTMANLRVSRYGDKGKVFRVLLWVQASYITVTAIWPLVDIESFMLVTGYKQDVWLVKTVGALLLPIAACLYSFLWIETDRRPAIILGALTALAFICIDFYYALKDVISDIYLADGVAEIFLLTGWLYILVAREWRQNSR